MSEKVILGPDESGLLPGPPVNLPEVPAMGPAPLDPQPGTEITIGARPQPSGTPDAGYAIEQQWGRDRNTLRSIMGDQSETLWVPEKFAYDAVRGSAVTIRNTVAAIGMGLTEAPTQAALGVSRILQKAGMVDEGTVAAVEAFHNQNVALGDAAMRRMDGGGFSASVREITAEGGAAATVALPAALAAPTVLPAGAVATAGGALAWLAGWTAMGAGREVDTENLMTALDRLGIDTGLGIKEGDTKARKIDKQMLDAAIMGSGIEWTFRGAKLATRAAKQARAMMPDASAAIAAAMARLAELPPSSIAAMREQARRGREWVRAMIDHPQALTARTAENELAQALAARDLDKIADIAEDVQRAMKNAPNGAPVAVVGPAAATGAAMEPDEEDDYAPVQVAGLGDVIFKLGIRAAQQAEKTVPKSIMEKADELTGAAAKLGRPSPDPPPMLVRKDFNLARIQTEDDIKAFINDVSDVLEKETLEHRRGVKTLDEIQLSAAQLQMTPDDVLNLRTVNAETLNKARNVMLALAEQVKTQAEIVADPARYSDAEALRLRQLMTLYGAVQTHTKGLITETARALSSLRIIAQADNLSGAAVSDMAQQLGGRGANIRIAKALKEMADDPARNAKLLANAWKATGWDMFMEYYYFALLSSPPTHLVNFTSSLGSVMWGVPENIVAGMIGATRRAMGGDGGVYIREAGSTWAGMVDGVMGGGREAWKAFRTGEPGAYGSRFDGQEVRRAITAENLRGLAPVRATNNVFGLFDSGSVTSKGFDLLGEYVIRGPSRVMQTADEFNKGLGYFMELRRRAVRQAMDEGRSGDDVARRADEILAAPEDAFPDVHIGARDFANEATFTSPLGPGMQSLQTTINMVPALRLVFPFIRTPANLVRYTFERSPLAPISSEVRQQLMGARGPAAQDMAIAKITLGSTIAGFAATLAQAGYITGGGPADPGNMTGTRVLKERLEATGWQEYSVRVPGTDKFVSYKRMDPFAMFLGVAADYQEVEAYMTDDERAGVAAALTISVYRNLTNKSWLQGLEQLGDMVANLETGGAQAAGNFVAGLAGTVAAPAGLNWINNTFFEEQRRMSRPSPYDEEGFRADPAMMFAEQMINRVKMRVPGLSPDLPPAMNFWGEAVVIKPGVEVGASVSTLKVDEGRLRGAGLPTSPLEWAKLSHPTDMDDAQFTAFVRAVGIDGEMVRLGTPVGPHPTRIMGIEMSGQQRADYASAVNTLTPRSGPYRGMTMKDAMEKLVQSRDYMRGSDVPEVANSKIEQLRKLARFYRHDADEDPRTGLGGADRVLVEMWPELARLVYERRAFTRPN